MWIALEELFKAVLFRFTTGLVGWKAWLAKLLIKSVLKAVHNLLSREDVRAEVKKELKNYEKVINDPKSSADDINDAFDDLIK